MNIELLKKVDFGEIDGYGDPNLEHYFLDNNYWQKIIDSKVFFVVGKKGTGKSAIYRMLENESFLHGSIVINKDFGEFPFEKLLQLQDDDLAQPNQYQTIWKNVILNLFIQNISKLPEEDNDYYKQISEYNRMYIGNAIDLHKDIITKSEKKQGNIFFKGLDCGIEKQTTNNYDCNDVNITMTNTVLSDLIVNYLMTTSFDNKIVIQFDRLDDNYNQYQDIEAYYQAMISLFKAVYGFNQMLRSKAIKNAKIVLYIRSDIMKAMATRDAESARWDDFRVDLQWNVNNMRDVENSNLMRMVNKRISASSDDLSNKTFNDVFDIDRSMLKKCGIQYNLFSSLVLQTLFRPRDLIKLIKTLQNEILQEGCFNESVYKIALKKYSNWLVNSEIANEINPVLGGDYKYTIELLRLCGSKALSVKKFTERYNSVKHEFGFSALELLEYLYSVGIIENTWKDSKTNKNMHRSIFRNEGDFDRNLLLRILPAVWSGITV